MVLFISGSILCSIYITLDLSDFAFAILTLPSHHLVSFVFNVLSSHVYPVDWRRPCIEMTRGVDIIIWILLKIIFVCSSTDIAPSHQQQNSLNPIQSTCHWVRTCVSAVEDPHEHTCLHLLEQSVFQKNVDHMSCKYVSVPGYLHAITFLFVFVKRLIFAEWRALGVDIQKSWSFDAATRVII